MTEEWHARMDKAVRLAESLQSNPSYAGSLPVQGLAAHVIWLAEHFDKRPSEVA